MSEYLDIARRVMRARQQETGLEPSERLEAVLKGIAVELWSDAFGEHLWIVADEEDARLLGEPRGAIYTAAEVRRVIEIGDPAIVADVRRWKRDFNASIREYRPESLSGSAEPGTETMKGQG